MSNKETYVKPHDRKNPKKSGKHHVTGHTRKIPKSKSSRKIGGSDEMTPAEISASLIEDEVKELREEEKELNKEIREYKDYLKDEYGKSYYQLTMEEMEGEDIAKAQMLFNSKIENIEKLIRLERNLPGDYGLKEFDSMSYSPGSMWNAWLNDLKPLASVGYVSGMKAEKEIQKLKEMRHGDLE